MEGIAQQLRLQMQSGILHGLADVEALQGEGDLLDDCLHAGRLGLECCAGASTDVDGDHTMHRGLRGDRAQEPDVLGLGIDDGAAGRTGRRGHGRDAVEHRLRHSLRFRRLEMAVGGGDEERGLRPEIARQVAADGGNQVADGETGGQALRKLVELLHLPLAPPQRVGLALEPGGEIAADQRDHEEEQEIDDLLRALDLQAVDRRKEEEVGGRHAGDGGEGGGPNPPLRGRDSDRNQVGHRHQRDRNLALDHQEGRGDQHDTEQRHH